MRHPALMPPFTPRAQKIAGKSNVTSCVSYSLYVTPAGSPQLRQIPVQIRSIRVRIPTSRFQESHWKAKSSTISTYDSIFHLGSQPHIFWHCQSFARVVVDRKKSLLPSVQAGSWWGGYVSPPPPPYTTSRRSSTTLHSPPPPHLVFFSHFGRGESAPEPLT
jgi:hypothetical protein